MTVTIKGEQYARVKRKTPPTTRRSYAKMSTRYDKRHRKAGKTNYSDSLPELSSEEESDE